MLFIKIRREMNINCEFIMPMRKLEIIKEGVNGETKGEVIYNIRINRSCNIILTRFLM